MSVLEIMKFVMAANCYPKFWLPIESSAERTFSKLKLLKNYLRSTMSQRKIKWFGNVQHREGYIGHCQSIPSLMILHQETSEEVSFYEKQCILLSANIC